MRKSLIVIFLFVGLSTLAQDKISLRQERRVAVWDTVVLDSSGINPKYFRVYDKEGKAPGPSSYRIDFKKGVVEFSEDLQHQYDSLTVVYYRYPDFLTREYFLMDSNVIVQNTGAMDQLLSLEQSTRKNEFVPFDGLNTSGSISRGITIGNNQNAEVNSELDLQITGKLSDKVSIRASMQDANMPTQEGGYSQNLNEFDQIFIELFGENWNIRAGDVDLEDTRSYFGRFSKKIQGISVSGTFKNENGSAISAYASGGMVRGIFTRSEFTGQEGNQGPYKLVGPNGELYILVVSGSEKVYVNGLLLRRGENEDYIIDYNSGEITFNATYPITSNMRISVEYQFTDRNYTRFIAHGGAEYNSEKLDAGVYLYSENDAKNQPLQQNLSEEQIEILKNAGDDPDLMMAPSAIPDTWSENKILYRKEFIGNTEIFVYSNDPDDELFHVRFTNVGKGNGNYIVSDNQAINRIYEYVPPINGVMQGEFEPIIRLKPPEKLQLAGINGRYRPTEKTLIDFEASVSNYDKNLFSDLDNGDNTGFAGRLSGRHNIFKTDSLEVNAYGVIDFTQNDFQTIERLYNIEFNRDWNLINPEGHQRFTTGGVDLFSRKYGAARYEFQNLNYSENFNGIRHLLQGNFQRKRLRMSLDGSAMNSAADSISSSFIRFRNKTTYSIGKPWVGLKIDLEDNRIKNKISDSISPASHGYREFEVFSGIGDSTDVYVEAGFNYRVNDSVWNSSLQRVNRSNTYYLKSQLINSESTQLSTFVNYRELRYDSFIPEKDPAMDEVIREQTKEMEKSLNSRIIYNQSLFNNGIFWNTILETNNGVVPQQEFTYVKVEPGQGVYKWVDYNNNGIQELDEFEVAQFPDEAEYIRVLLPNQLFINIRQNKFSQTLTLNPQEWSDREGLLGVFSKFYNQTSYILDRKVKRDTDGFNINPFKDGGNNQLGLQSNFRNVLFFNRGKQRYTTSYTFLSNRSDNLLAIGLQRNELQSHQLNFAHKVREIWLINLKSATHVNKNYSENFPNRNFELEGYEVNPKISFLQSFQTRFDLYYNYKTKGNRLGEKEDLLQQTLGFSFSYANAEKVSVNGEFNYIANRFKGSAYSPVAYQMLEGLQPGTNFTWQLLLQKRITQYLDANFMYHGRKSEMAHTIHTGSVQLRAYF